MVPTSYGARRLDFPFVTIVGPVYHWFYMVWLGSSGVSDRVNIFRNLLPLRGLLLIQVITITECVTGKIQLCIFGDNPSTAFRVYTEP